jgi:phosphatidylglycerol phospholipase C
MNETIVAQPSWQTVLAPRIVLGLWHPKFLKAAKEFLPYCRRTNLGSNPAIARKYFWRDVDGFSIMFDALVTPDGQK